MRASSNPRADAAAAQGPAAARHYCPQPHPPLQPGSEGRHPAGRALVLTVWMSRSRNQRNSPAALPLGIEDLTGIRRTCRPEPVFGASRHLDEKRSCPGGGVLHHEIGAALTWLDRRPLERGATDHARSEGHFGRAVARHPGRAANRARRKGRVKLCARNRRARAGRRVPRCATRRPPHQYRADHEHQRQKPLQPGRGRLRSALRTAAAFHVGYRLSTANGVLQL